MFIVTGENVLGREYVDSCHHRTEIPEVGAKMRIKGYVPNRVDEWQFRPNGLGRGAAAFAHTHFPYHPKW